jgi:hypothetical protein
MSIFPSVRTKAQWLCDLPWRDPAAEGLRATAHLLFTPSFQNPLSAAGFSEVHALVKHGFAALLKGEQWSHKIVSAEAFVKPIRASGIGKGGGVKMGLAREQKEVFIFEAMRILAEVKDRLRVCGRSGCGRPICAVKRQEYCAACAKEARKQSVKDWRAEHPEEVRKWAKAHYRQRKQRKLAARRRPR